MIIRDYCDVDCEPLAELFYHTVHKINVRDYNISQVEAWAPKNRDMEKWRSSFKDKLVFIAEENKKIIGFGELEPNGHIDRFYIDSNWIRKGIGKKIYGSIEKRAKEQNISELFLEASITAKPFFIRMGFTVCKEQTVVSRGINMTNFVMKKTLSTFNT